MDLDGRFSDSEVGADLLVQLPADEVCQHFPFACREAVVSFAKRAVPLANRAILAIADERTRDGRQQYGTAPSDVLVRKSTAPDFIA